LNPDLNTTDYQAKLNTYLNQRRDKPVVLIADWSNSNMLNSGFAEAAADALFAGLVSLDQQLGGTVGGYDATGKLNRTQGALFNRLRVDSPPLAA
jgi:hypothetical protein